MNHAEDQAARTVDQGLPRAGDIAPQPRRCAQPEQTTLGTATAQARANGEDADLALIQQHLAELVQRDERVLVVSLLRRRRLTDLSDACGVRFREAGGELDDAVRWCFRKAEPNCRPVMLLCAGDLGRCFDRLVQEFPARRPPVTLVLCPDGQHASQGTNRTEALALSLLRLVDNLAIMIPTDRYELRTMLQLSAAQGAPAAVVLERGLARAKAHHAGPFGWGEAALLEQGRDMALVAVGRGVAAASIAARRLVRRGVQTTVVNARFVHPLDAGLLVGCARRCQGLVILEDGIGHGGFGSTVLKVLTDRSVVTPVRVLELKGNGSSSPGDHREAVVQIVQQVEQIRHMARGDAARGPEQLLPSSTKRRRLAHPGVSAHVLRAAPTGPGQRVRSTQLSPSARRWVRTYSRIGRRTTYLWKWCLHGLELTTLPCVLPELRGHLRDTKLLAIMLGVLLDDVADHPGRSDFLEALVDLVSGARARDVSSFSAAQQQYAGVTRGFRDEFYERIARYPCHAVYAELLQFDNLQVWNTMRYADLVNRHLSLLNLVEHDLYLTHNMQMMSFATLDLMCSPDFECTELGRLREAIWHAQCMARIGNLISTWQREIPDRDFTSAVFARAVLRGELTPDQLEAGDRKQIEAAIRKGRHEEYFLDCWRQQREHLQAMRPEIRSFDLGQLVCGLDRLIEMELHSRGRK